MVVRCFLLLLALLLPPLSAWAATPWQEWNALCAAIRSEAITPAQARAQAKTLLPQLRVASREIGSMPHMSSAPERPSASWGAPA